MEAECSQVLSQITQLIRCDTLLRICEIEACKLTKGNYSIGWSRESAKGMQRELKKEKGAVPPLSDATHGWSVLWPYIDSRGNVFIKCAVVRRTDPLDVVANNDRGRHAVSDVRRTDPVTDNEGGETVSLGYRHPIVDSLRACHDTPFRLGEWGLMFGDAGNEHEACLYRW
jgi:hypothetical protein